MSKGNPFISDDDDEEEVDELVRQEIITIGGVRVTPMCILIDRSSEFNAQRDATMLATILQTSVPPPTLFLLTVMLGELLAINKSNGIVIEETETPQTKRALAKRKQAEPPSTES